MPDINRADVIECKRLDDLYDLDSISFEDAQWLFHDFVKDIFISSQTLTKLGVSVDIVSKIKHYIKQIENHLHGSISDEDLNNEGTKAWMLHDQLTGCDKATVRFVLTGLYDEKKALFNEYGPSMQIELLVSLAYSLGGTNLCKTFSNYLEHYPRMNKYKL